MWETPGSLREHRLAVWTEALIAEGYDISRSNLTALHDEAHAAYEASWRLGRQFTVDDAVDLIHQRLDGRLPERAKTLVLAGYSEAGHRATVTPSPEIATCLRALRRAGVRVGLISDIGLTPSAVVREMLARQDLLDLFDATIFSDEVGLYKPAKEIFELALTKLGGVDPSDAAHVGDRRRTDVAGARGAGMQAVRYTGAYDDPDLSAPEACIVIDAFADLPGALESMFIPQTVHPRSGSSALRDRGPASDESG